MALDASCPQAKLVIEIDGDSHPHVDPIQGKRNEILMYIGYERLSPGRLGAAAKPSSYTHATAASRSQYARARGMPGCLHEIIAARILRVVPARIRLRIPGATSETSG